MNYIFYESWDSVEVKYFKHDLWHFHNFPAWGRKTKIQISINTYVIANNLLNTLRFDTVDVIYYIENILGHLSIFNFFDICSNYF